MSDHVVTLSSGRKLAYAEYGDPTGTPLLYYHGWPSSRLQAALLDKVAKEHHLRVIGPDRPGIGMSDFHPGRRILDWPEVITDLTQALGIDKFLVMGVSGGGPYVLVTAHAMPERVLGATVICGAPPLRVVGTRGLMWPYRVALFLRHRIPPLLGYGLRASARISYQKQNGWLMRRMMASLGPEDRAALAVDDNYAVITKSFQEAMRGSVEALQVDGDLYTSDWEFDTSGITIPIRFWHGDLDRNIPLGMVQSFASKIPQATLSVAEGHGHYSLPLSKTREIVQQLLAS